MILGDHQLDRYARHIVLNEIGGEGQKRLLASRVAVIGAGGIGSPVLLYLAAAGVGKLKLVDDDRVALDNLQRQILFGVGDIGKRKADAARQRIGQLDPDIELAAVEHRLTTENVADFLEGSDLVVDGSDNFATRLAVSDQATAMRIPLVSAAIGRFQIQIGTFRGWEQKRPCYRCFVGNAFDSDDCDTCAAVGVLGAVAGMAGSWAAMEAIRQLTGFGEDAAGKLHIFDGLKPAMRTLRLAKDPACPACSFAGS